MEAARAIEAIGLEAKSGTPALLEALNDQDEEVREAVAKALANTRSEPQVVVPKLIQRLKIEDNVGVRLSIMTALRSFGRASVTALLEALKETNPEFRVLVIEAIGDLGPNARNAIPVLTELSKDPNEKVRREAEAALEKIAENPRAR